VTQIHLIFGEDNINKMHDRFDEDQAFFETEVRASSPYDLLIN
jgi:hypothetical protein